MDDLKEASITENLTESNENIEQSSLNNKNIGKFQQIKQKLKDKSAYVKNELKFVNDNNHPLKAFIRKILLFFHILYWDNFYRQYQKLDLFFRDIFSLNYININQVEIEITTLCNLRCLNCNRSCRQAPSNEHMSVEQIKKFIDESIQAKKKWIEIRLIGGEPSLHPDIHKIIDLFIQYKISFSPYTKITLVTNGFGSKVSKVLDEIPEIIYVENSMKISSVHSFSTYNVAPIDVKAYKNKKIKFSKGCFINYVCGIALTRYGFYPCGPGASVDRIFNFNIGIKKFADVNEKAFRKQLSCLCMYCGSFKKEKLSEYVQEEIMSPTWQKAYAAYKEEKPQLSLY